MNIHNIMKDHGVHMHRQGNLNLRDALIKAHDDALREQREGIAEMVNKMMLDCKYLPGQVRAAILAYDGGGKEEEDTP